MISKVKALWQSNLFDRNKNKQTKVVLVDLTTERERQTRPYASVGLDTKNPFFLLSFEITKQILRLQNYGTRGYFILLFYHQTFMCVCWFITS